MSCSETYSSSPVVEACDQRLSEDNFKVSQYAESSVSLRVATLRDNNDEEIPHTMKLNKESINNLKPDAKMKEIQFELFGNIYETKDDFTAQSVIAKNSGKYGSIAFVVRRPGCFFCREEALTLTVLAKKHPALVEGFHLFGIVKEFNVDNEGLFDFHDKYYPFPIYHDDSQTFYNAFGNRRINPISTLVLTNPFSKVGKRLKHKNIKGNLKGEGSLQGGIVFFDSLGQPKYMHEEVTGLDLPVDEVVAVLNAIRDESS